MLGTVVSDVAEVEDSYTGSGEQGKRLEREARIGICVLFLLKNLN